QGTSWPQRRHAAEELARPEELPRGAEEDTAGRPEAGGARPVPAHQGPGPQEAPPEGLPPNPQAPTARPRAALEQATDLLHPLGRSEFGRLVVAALRRRGPRQPAARRRARPRRRLAG